MQFQYGEPVLFDMEINGKKKRYTGLFKSWMPTGIVHIRIICGSICRVPIEDVYPYTKQQEVK